MNKFFDNLWESANKGVRIWFLPFSSLFLRDNYCFGAEISSSYSAEGVKGITAVSGLPCSGTNMAPCEMI